MVQWMSSNSSQPASQLVYMYLYTSLNCTSVIARACIIVSVHDEGEAHAPTV